MGCPASGDTPEGSCPGSFPSPTPHVPAAPFSTGERIICFSCCPDLWSTLFFIYLHKLSEVTGSFPEVRDSVNTSGSQVSRPARGGGGYRRSPGSGQWIPARPRLTDSAPGLVRQRGRGHRPGAPPACKPECSWTPQLSCRGALSSPISQRRDPRFGETR